MPEEDITRSWFSASQEDRPQQKPTLLVPWSRTSILQNCGKIHFCCLSHPVYAILLWQPKQTHAHTYPFYKGLRETSGHTVTKSGSKRTSALTMCSLHSCCSWGVWKILGGNGRVLKSTDEILALNHTGLLLLSASLRVDWCEIQRPSETYWPADSGKGWLVASSRSHTP